VGKVSVADVKRRGVMMSDGCGQPDNLPLDTARTGIITMGAEPGLRQDIQRCAMIRPDSCGGRERTVHPQALLQILSRPGKPAI
jgi:hypothetical protein